MNRKKLIAGIFSLALFASGSMLNISAAAGNRNSRQETTEPEAVSYKGDLTQNGSVDVAEVIMMQKYLLGKQKITEEKFHIADINDDNSVSVYDLLWLKKAVLSGEWITVVPEEPTEPPTEDPTEPSAEDPTEDSTEESTEKSTEESTEKSTEESTEPTTENPFLTPPIKVIDAGLPSQGTGNLVIFYVDFPDCPYTYAPTAEEIQQIAFGAEDTTNPNYPFESMSAFYSRSSKGSMKLTGKVFRYTAKENQAAYDTDKNKLLHECYEAFDAEVDFSQFDGDGDGKIDATLLTVPTAAGDTNWWPCAGDSGSMKTFDGVGIGHLITGNAQIDSVTSYKNFTTSYQHEMGHCMGLPDYYLYYTEDFEAFHGEVNTAGLELMDVDVSTDFCCFSKLQLGWYKKEQILAYDTAKGGEQSFTLTNAQTDNGNCLILPYGDLNYNSEYLILEYFTAERNNSSPIYEWMSSGNGIRAYHVKADIHDNGWWKHYKYENGSEFTNYDDKGIRLIRLVNDAEGGNPYISGQTMDGNISGWHWYAEDESESVDTGYTVKIGELKDGSYTVTVNKTETSNKTE